MPDTKKKNKTLYLKVSSLQEWQSWLTENHEKEKEVWLVFYKKETGIPCCDYEPSVEEALCWGWIDSLIKRLDEQSYARKFTPRTNTAKWSALNLKRMQKLIQENRLKPAGMAKIEPGLLDGSQPPLSKPNTAEIPPEIKDKLSADPRTWENFNNLANSYKKNAMAWILSAKKDETRQKRLTEFMELLAQNKKLGLK